MIVVVGPGQGSQTPGFLAPWIEDPTSRSLLRDVSDAAGVDLVAHGTVSDADTIRDTAIAQPLIVAAGIVAWQALQRAAGSELPQVDATAGHSVGEFTAAVVAGILSPEDAVRLVGIRGRAMAEAAATVATGMAAVLRGEPADIDAALAEHGLTPANFNGGGQTVVAGPLDGIAALQAAPPAKARVIPLQVAGAFHTDYMAPAVDVLRSATADVAIADPVRTIFTNRDGLTVASGRRFVELMVDQVSNPVHWDHVMESFSAAGVTGIVELAPAGTLVGLAKRALKGVATVAVKTPDDIPAALELIGAAE